MTCKCLHLTTDAFRADSSRHQIYFEMVHPSTPMMHKYRYFAALGLPAGARPPICLRYIMWALACTLSEKYCGFSERYYERARRYAENDEMKGQGEAFITISHAQAWCLIATYEFKCMYFPRAWVSVGKASRLVQMMGLHRVDGGGLEVKQCIKPPQDWTDREERRRTFWAAYCADRYASIGTGWPMTMDESDVRSFPPLANHTADYCRFEVIYRLRMKSMIAADPARSPCSWPML